MIAIWIIILGFIFGASLGSFVKVLADRSLTSKTFLGRSICIYCRKKLAWYDLIPLFAYLSLKGHCRYCHKKISLEYFLIEAVIGILVAFVFYQTIPAGIFESTIVEVILTIAQTLFKAFAIGVFIAVLITDLKKGIIPDRITYPASLIALLFLIFFSLAKILLFYLSLESRPVGKFLLPLYSSYFVVHAISIANPFLLGILSGALLVIFFGSLIVITKGKGMGGGDLKLSFFMGLTLGFPGAILAVLLAFLSGSIVGIFLLLTQKKHFGQTIPFGPFLTIGSLAALFWGEKIVNWYLHLNF